MDHRDVLKEAAKVLGDRGQTYGGVEESFTRAAKLATLKLDREITAYDVAIILESVKDARRAKNPGHFDSHLDGINYRAFAAEFAGAGTPPAAPPTNRQTVPADPLQRAMAAVDRELTGGQR